MINKMHLVSTGLFFAWIIGTIYRNVLFKRDNLFVSSLIYLHFLLFLLLFYAELDRFINKRKY